MGVTRTIPLNPSLPVGLAVEVYWNLHKDVFSVRDRKTGLVIGHCDEVRLSKVKFHVNQGGRERVLRERKKNVHAFVRGTIIDHDPITLTPIRYNPYEAGFFRGPNGNPVMGAQAVCMKDGKILARF
jgi:hypothetical protein